jgi:iron complex outermembrane receptor protein
LLIGTPAPFVLIGADETLQAAGDARPAQGDWGMTKINSFHRMRARWMRCAAAGALGFSALSANTPVLAQDRGIAFQLPARPLADTLLQISRQGNVDVTAPEALTRGRTAPTIDGRMSVRDALDRALKGSGLRLRQNGDSSYIVELSPRGNASAADAGDAAEGSEDSDIVVTGSTIRGVVPAGSNLMVLDEKDVARSGASSVQDLFRTIPAQYSGGPSVQDDQRSGIGQSNPARGASLDLRGLGSDATLTLVNGRRLAPSGDGSFVNVDAIPFSAIERVEILADGASATYGSDAIAGVVNIILKRNLNGLDLKARVALPTQGGGEEFLAAGSYGKSWSTGGFLLGAQYVRRNDLLSRQRPYSASCDLREFGGTNFCVITSAPGNITSPGALAGAIPDGQDGRALTAAQINKTQPNYGDATTGVNTLPNRRQISGFGSVHQAITDSITVYADAMLTDQSFTNYGGATLASLSVPATNAFRQLNGLGLPGTAPIVIQYSFLEDVGNSRTDVDARTYSFDAGLTIDLTEKWTVDAYVAHGRDKTTTLTSNVVDTRSLANGGALLTALASSNLATAFNPFGDGDDNSASVIAGLLYTNSRFADLDFTSWNARVNGELFDIGAGPIKVAAGVEYRTEHYRNFSQSLFRSGVIPAPTDRQGGRNAKAVFAEAYLPVFNESRSLPGMRLLDMSASVRLDRYSDFGETVNPKIGVRWSPLGGVIFRGSFGTSFKAPRLSDLLSPRTLQYLGATTAFGGIDRNKDSVLNLAILQGGSPDLTAEKGKSYTLGVDFEPAFLPGLKAHLTYYNINIRDRISSFSDIRTILSNPASYEGIIYFPLPSDALVAQITGTPDTILGLPFAPGEVEGLLNVGRANIARVKTDGLDFDLRYSFDAAGGLVETSLRSTYVLGLTNQQNPGLPPLKGFDVVGGPVDLKVRAGATWSGDGLQLSAFANYIDKYTNRATTPYERIKANVTFDAQVSYQLGDRMGSALSGTRLSLTAINLFDKDPPFVDSGSSAFDGTNYSVMGRVVSLEISRKF